MEEKANLVWSIEKTHPEHHNDLIEALAGVTDPELGFSVVELGLVRNISLKDGKANIVMILTTPFCPYGPALLENTRAMVEKTLGLPTEIEFSDLLWDPSMMDPELRDNDWGLFP